MLTKQIVAMALMVLMGYVATKKKVINGEQSKIISRTLIYVITPCNLINAFQTEFEIRKLEGLVVATVIAAVAHGIIRRAIKYCWWPFCAPLAPRPVPLRKLPRWSTTRKVTISLRSAPFVPCCVW